MSLTPTTPPAGTRLDKGAQIKLTAAGTGSATFGPARSNETWTITRMTTKGTSTLEPTLDILRGSTSVLDSTPHGNNDVSDSDDIDLFAGEFITARYTGGTANAVMTFYLEGTVSYT